MKTEEEAGVMQIQAKEHRRLPATARSLEKDMEQVLHPNLMEEPTLSTPSIQTSRLQGIWE